MCFVHIETGHCIKNADDHLLMGIVPSQPQGPDHQAPVTPWDTQPICWDVVRAGWGGIAETLSAKPTFSPSLLLGTDHRFLSGKIHNPWQNS